ncbi:sensor histidine kinase, partial [Curtobacterium flaccumfaciens]
SEPTEVQAVALFAPAVVLVSAWLVGVLVRLRRTNRVETALRERAQVHADRAEEAARFERLRADIARDVHDVVGHALTVVIAQSDLASFVDDVDRLHDITATIGTTARSSMREIRDVLDDTEEVARPGSRQETVAALVGELRGAGVDVRRTVDGVPTSVPDRSGIVIRRIVQEMLTNAVRHGVPATPVLLRERWSPEMLVIEAQNQIADEPDSGGGRGIPGIRTRLAAISGDVEIERADGVFRIRVHVPLTASTSGRAE